MLQPCHLPGSREAENTPEGLLQPSPGCPALCGSPGAGSHSCSRSWGSGKVSNPPGKCRECAWENAHTLHWFLGIISGWWNDVSVDWTITGGEVERTWRFYVYLGYVFISLPLSPPPNYSCSGANSKSWRAWLGVNSDLVQSDPSSWLLEKKLATKASSNDLLTASLHLLLGVFQSYCMI